MQSTEHVTPLLIQLHWLSVSERINFKILLLTFKALHNLSLTYLTNLIQTYTPSCSLRSSTINLLALPPINLNTMGARAFSYTAPKFWVQHGFSNICQLVSLPNLRRSSDFSGNAHNYGLREPFSSLIRNPGNKSPGYFWWKCSLCVKVSVNESVRKREGEIRHI